MCKVTRVYLGNRIKYISSSDDMFEKEYKKLCAKYGEDNLRVEVDDKSKLKS